MNRVLVTGRVCGTASTSSFGDHKICKFSIDHVQELKEDKVKHHFFECEGWNAIAQEMSYVEPNDNVLIDGELKFSSWEDANTQAKRNKVSINVRSVTKLAKEKKDDIPI